MFVNKKGRVINPPLHVCCGNNTDLNFQPGIGEQDLTHDDPGGLGVVLQGFGHGWDVHGFAVHDIVDDFHGFRHFAVDHVGQFLVEGVHDGGDHAVALEHDDVGAVDDGPELIGHAARRV